MTVNKSKEYVRESESDSDSEFEVPKEYNPIQLGALENKEKEVWLIKAPKGIPLKELKQINVSFDSPTLEKEAEPFVLRNRTYQALEDQFAKSSNGRYTVIGPENNEKRISTFNINRFYNIREAPEKPKVDYSKVKGPVEQIGEIGDLRMRYFPTGYGARDYAESSPGFFSGHQNSGIDANNDGHSYNEKIVKKAKVDNKENEKREKKDKKEKREKKEKKEKKDKKERKEKKEKKDKEGIQNKEEKAE